MTEREGRLTIDGDRAVLNFERRLPFPIEVVWLAITDPDERGQWIGETTIDAREGGTIEMVATGPPLPPERKRMTGRILVWDPPHVLEHEWKQPIVEAGVVRYELSADGTGTLLRFSHRGLGVRNATGFLGGTHAFLDRLEAYLAMTSCRTGRTVAGKSSNHHNRRLIDMSHNGSHIAAPNLAIAYHSGFGHTAVLAHAVAEGAATPGPSVSVIAVDRITDADWDTLDGADGIVFGSATYMGNVSAGFQAFAERTGRRCQDGTWRDKVAAGFTNSGAKSGDKLAASDLACGLRRSAPHALGEPGFGRRLEQHRRAASTTSTDSGSGSVRARSRTSTPGPTRSTRPTCGPAAPRPAGRVW